MLSQGTNGDAVVFFCDAMAAPDMDSRSFSAWAAKVHNQYSPIRKYWNLRINSDDLHQYEDALNPLFSFLVSIACE
jgi:hypothetical protein